VSAPIWKPRPTPGEMKLCQDCPHRRDDERRNYRCAVTRHSPFLPPLVEFRAGGKEHCGWWPPRTEAADPNQLSLLEATG